MNQRQKKKIITIKKMDQKIDHLIWQAFQMDAQGVQDSGSMAEASEEGFEEVWRQVSKEVWIERSMK